MKLTCVTAVFNAVKSGNCDNLIRCIESVAALATEHEHLIYDGASTDGTVELLKELENKIPALKVVSEKDTGIYNALNKGVRDAKGDWFYVLGCDDYISNPSVLDQLLTQMSDDVDEIVAPVEREDGQRPFFRKIKDLSVIFRTVPYSHQGMILRTRHVRRFGGFDESYKICADWDMMNKVHHATLNIEYTFRPFAFYASGGLSDNSHQGWLEVRSIIEKHLNLTDEEAHQFREIGFPPLNKMLPYLFGKDLAYRLGAREMVWRNLKFHFLRFLSIMYRPIKRLFS